MKEEATVLSILVETLIDSPSAKKMNYEEELGVILVLARKFDLKIGEAHRFNEITEKNPEPLKKVKKIVKQE